MPARELGGFGAGNRRDHAWRQLNATVEQHATRRLAPRCLDVSETIEFSSGAPRGLGVAAMKCQSYQRIPYFENTVCDRRSHRLGYLLSAPAIAKPGFVHDLIHDTR